MHLPNDFDNKRDVLNKLLSWTSELSNKGRHTLKRLKFNWILRLKFEFCHRILHDENLRNLYKKEVHTKIFFHLNLDELISWK